MAGVANVKWTTTGPVASDTSKDRHDVMHQAMRDSRRLAEFLSVAASDGQSVLLPVNDPHRATQTRCALEALSQCVGDSSRDMRFRAIVATGTHRFDADERRHFETATFDGCGLRIADVFWHDAGCAEDLVEVAGRRFHRSVSESACILPVGSVEPHYFAGLTGAHKTVTIGCMSRADIERNHAHAMASGADIFRLAGNPVYDDVLATLRALQSAGKHICAVNQIVCGDSLPAAAVGDAEETLHELLPAVRSVFCRTISDVVDVLHLKVPLPLGRNLYQADKALKNNHPAVRDGGGIILEADCPEGVGPDAFLQLLRVAPDYRSAIEHVRDKGYALGDHKAVKLRHLTDPTRRDVRVALVSRHITETDADAAGIRVFTDSGAAGAWLAHATSGILTCGLIVHDAGHVTVRVA